MVTIMFVYKRSYRITDSMIALMLIILIHDNLCDNIKLKYKGDNNIVNFASLVSTLLVAFAWEI